jgi:predicted nucleic acid-binding protein
MNGSDEKRFVIDTNVVFMSLYDGESKAARLIKFDNCGKIKLFSPESVKKEISLVLEREMDFSEEEILFILDSLPITWIKKEFYREFINKTKVKHLPDKPVEAVSLMLNCGILSADYDFKDREDINKLLKELEDAG